MEIPGIYGPILPCHQQNMHCANGDGYLEFICCTSHALTAFMLREAGLPTRAKKAEGGDFDLLYNTIITLTVFLHFRSWRITVFLEGVFENNDSKPPAVSPWCSQWNYGCFQNTSTLPISQWLLTAKINSQL